MILKDYLRTKNYSIRSIDIISEMLRIDFKIKNIWNQSIFNILTLKRKNKKLVSMTIKELVDTTLEVMKNEKNRIK